MRLVLACVALFPFLIPAAAHADRIACEAPFGPDASHDGLEKAFGAENVTFETLDGTEGEEVATTVVFSNDPEKRLEVVWWDVDKRKGISNVTLVEGASWVFGNGLALGQSLAEIEKANGRPFDMNGFDWDYGGAVVDWKGGTLGVQPGGCTLGVFFMADDATPAEARDAVSGDQLFSSGDPKIKAVKPTVTVIYFGYPE